MQTYLISLPVRGGPAHRASECLVPAAQTQARRIIKVDEKATIIVFVTFMRGVNVCHCCVHRSFFGSTIWECLESLQWRAAGNTSQPPSRTCNASSMQQIVL